VNPDFSIPQAMYELSPNELIPRGSSSQFPSDREETVRKLLNSFGDPPSGIRFEEVLFVLPFDHDRMAIVSVISSPTRFRILLVHRSLYYHIPDPFRYLDRFPPNWESRSELRDLEWSETDGPLYRRVDQLQEVLKNGNGPLLLAATQAIVDTEHVLLKRDVPATKLLRDIWMLLPEATRRSSQVATYCFAPEPIFHFSAGPNSLNPEMLGYWDEERILDYPDSRYERHLQVAIESGDQAEVDRLFARRTTSETIRLMLLILGLLAAISVIARLLVFPAR
jgi:hypothetical protein